MRSWGPRIKLDCKQTRQNFNVLEFILNLLWHDWLFFYFKDNSCVWDISWVAGDFTNINETDTRSLKFKSTICRSHKILSNVGLDPTALSIVKNDVAAVLNHYTIRADCAMRKYIPHHYRIQRCHYFINRLFMLNADPSMISSK